MLLHFCLTIACIVAIEIFIRSGFLTYLATILQTANKVSHVIIAAKISDHWKEKVVPTYAFIIFRNSLLILAILIAIAMVFFGFSQLSNELIMYTLTVKGIIESVIIAYIYIKVKNMITA